MSLTQSVGSPRPASATRVSLSPGLRGKPRPASATMDSIVRSGVESLHRRLQDFFVAEIQRWTKAEAELAADKSKVAVIAAQMERHKTAEADVEAEKSKVKAEVERRKTAEKEVEVEKNKFAVQLEADKMTILQLGEELKTAYAEIVEEEKRRKKEATDAAEALEMDRVERSNAEEKLAEANGRIEDLRN